MRPLRKKTPEGVVYTRREETDRIISEVLGLSDAQALLRCEVQSREIAGYLPSECLVYLVRTGYGAADQTRERIFSILAERVLNQLPDRTSSQAIAVSLSSSDIADEVFGRFLELLMADRQTYDERLDALEVCFDKVLKSRRLDAERKVLRSKQRAPALEFNDATGDVSDDLRREGGSVQINSLQDIERNASRLDVDAAIDQLPDLQRQILHLVRSGFPMYSEKHDIFCITKALKKSDKTIRSHHQQAIATIQSIIEGEKIS